MTSEVRDSIISRAYCDIFMKTLSIKSADIRKSWWVADAEGQTLGRFAAKISQILHAENTSLTLLTHGYG